MHNSKLAKKQGLTKLETDIIDSLHDYRDMLESYANLSPYILRWSDKHSESQSLFPNNTYIKWMNVNHILQKLWKFEEDDNYIKFWTFPGCSCPKRDNEDAYPSGHYVYNQSCIIHRNKKEK